MSLKNLDSISNIEGWDLTLDAYKKKYSITLIIFVLNNSKAWLMMILNRPMIITIISEQHRKEHQTKTCSNTVELHNVKANVIANVKHILHIRFVLLSLTLRGK